MTDRQTDLSELKRSRVVDFHRLWLARQLTDPTLSDAEAYSIVAFSPAIKKARGE